MTHTLHSARPFGRGLRAGFTLIELLVVVLIIGILAAVALPQYRVAVERSRAVALLPVARALADAQEVYYMSNGMYSVRFEDLGVQPPSGGSWNGEYLLYPDGSKLYIGDAQPMGYVVAVSRKVQFDLLLHHHLMDMQEGLYCYASPSDSVAMRVCRTGGAPTGRRVGCSFDADCVEHRWE